MQKNKKEGIKEGGRRKLVILRIIQNDVCILKKENDICDGLVYIAACWLVASFTHDVEDATSQLVYVGSTCLV